jgi:sigma-B regulation protein RsbU (phosphoserine phosphatase)
MIRTLPARQLKFFWLAIFSTFSMFGFVLDIMARGRQPAVLLVMNGVASGTLSILYAIASMPARRARYLAVLTAHLAYAFLVPRAFGLLPAAPPRRLLLDAIGIMATVLTGYSMFLRFINITAARYLRAETEIEVAHRIHQVLVPAIERQVGAYEFFGWSIASGEVGGDLVDLVDEGGRWLAYVADVSGHGVGPGVIMGMFKSALRMRARGPGTVGSLLDDVHAVLMPLKDPATFVTVACVRGIDTGQIDCAVAGHLPILRVRHGTVEELTEPQLVLGMFEGTTFTSRTAATEPGDLLALLTDGLIEVFDPENRELGFDWAKRVLAADADRPLSAIADRLLAEARRHGPQLDDQTLLLIRRKL